MANGAEELPLGLAMALGMHPDARERFSSLPRSRQMQILQKAKQVSSRQEMDQIVSNLDKG